GTFSGGSDASAYFQLAGLVTGKGIQDVDRVLRTERCGGEEGEAAAGIQRRGAPVAGRGRADDGVEESRCGDVPDGGDGGSGGWRWVGKREDAGEGGEAVRRAPRC